MEKHGGVIFDRELAKKVSAWAPYDIRELVFIRAAFHRLQDEIEDVFGRIGKTPPSFKYRVTFRKVIAGK